MAQRFIEIQGLAGITANLKSFADNVQHDVNYECLQGAININEDAKQTILSKTGRRTGRLYNSQHVTADFTRNEFGAANDAYYSPYVEFGTGVNVSVPPDLREYALQFKRGPGGRMHARPFLYPAILKETPRLIQRISHMLGVTILGQATRRPTITI